MTLNLRTKPIRSLLLIPMPLEDGIPPLKLSSDHDPRRHAYKLDPNATSAIERSQGASLEARETVEREAEEQRTSPSRALQLTEPAFGRSRHWTRTTIRNRR